MSHYGQALEVLFYEVLDMPLREYEQLKHMKVRTFPAFPLSLGCKRSSCDESHATLQAPPGFW